MNERLSLTMDSELKKILEKLASDEGLSLSAYIRRILIMDVKKKKIKN